MTDKEKDKKPKRNYIKFMRLPGVFLDQLVCSNGIYPVHKYSF